MGYVNSTGNMITAEGDFGYSDLKIALAAFHNLTEKSGYQNIELDFSKMTKVLAPDILPLCVYVRDRLHKGIDTSVTLPEDRKLARLFQNTNWAYLIDPREFAKSERETKDHLPAIVYTSGDEQYGAVENIIDILLKSLSNLTRNQLAALEWSVNEITDNVLNHSESAVGGIVQTTSRKNGELIEFVVCDAGLGIPKTLRAAHADITSDQDALDRAIREGITRNKSTNMGNGLYGSYRTAQVSGGAFLIYSGYSALRFDKRNGLHVSAENVPFNGTLVACTIDCTKGEVLEEALVFRGKKYTPSYSYFDRLDDDEIVTVKMSEETKSFGSRETSAPIRIKLENVLKNSSSAIEIDMSDVELISSSFADEIFGKIFHMLGPLSFMQRIKITGMNRLVSQLVDRAMTQRISS